MAKATASGKKDILIMTNSGDLYVIYGNQLGEPLSQPAANIAKLKTLLRQHRGETLGLVAAVAGTYDAIQNGSLLLPNVERALRRKRP